MGLVIATGLTWAQEIGPFFGAVVKWPPPGSNHFTIEFHQFGTFIVISNVIMQRNLVKGKLNTFFLG